MTALFATASIILTVVCVFFQKRRVGRLALVAPSSIFIIGICARYAIGSTVIRLTPREWVLEGEYSQYLVTWQYIEKTSGIWLIYLTFAFIAYCIIVLASRKRVSCLLRRRDGYFNDYKDRGSIALASGLKALALGMIVFFLVETIVGMVTGSSDRGSSYHYWASQAFKPISGFVALSRLRQLAYLLVPSVLISIRSLPIRVVILTLCASDLLLGVVAGGRGTVLYPLVMMWVGWVIAGARRRAILGVTISLVIGLGLVVPALAAYRDSAVIRKTSSSDVIGRLGGMVSQFDTRQYRYRLQALGREIYACSDSFIFLDRNKSLNGVGFSDIDETLLRRILLPRALSGGDRIEKNDGSTIAKRMIGVNNPTWFPCLTSPGDLWRRGGNLSVGYGGLVVGLIVGILELIWLWIGCTKRGVLAGLLILFPATYLHYGLYGTVRELIWQIGWELPKYVVVLLVISSALKFTKNVRSRRREECSL